MNKFIAACENPDCRFRFPLSENQVNIRGCPKCGSLLRLIEFLDHSSDDSPGSTETPSPQPHIEILLDNIRSGLNVGSIFRTSDGAGVSFIHLGGITPTPDQAKVAKAALGAEKTIPWSQQWNCLDFVKGKIEEKYTVISLEKSKQSISIFSLPQILTTPSILLVVGNEMTGVDPDILSISHFIVSIPMLGYKESLNVAVAFGIAIYQLTNHFHKQ